MALTLLPRRSAAPMGTSRRDEAVVAMVEAVFAPLLWAVVLAVLVLLRVDSSCVVAVGDG